MQKTLCFLALAIACSAVLTHAAPFEYGDIVAKRWTAGATYYYVYDSSLVYKSQ